MNLGIQVSNRRSGGFPRRLDGCSVPDDATRWALVNAKKKAEVLEVENARLRERIRELEGKVYDLGGDPAG